MARYNGGDGGASGVVYGCAAAGVVGGTIGFGLLTCIAMVYIALWPITVPATLAYVLWYFPWETLDFAIHLPFYAWAVIRDYWYWILAGLILAETQ